MDIKQIEPVDMEFTHDAAQVKTFEQVKAERGAAQLENETLRHEFTELEKSYDAAVAKLSEYEGENKRWHSFETVQAIVKERGAAEKRSAEKSVRISELQQELDSAMMQSNANAMHAETNHETIEKILAASKSKDTIIAGLNRKVVDANQRAEQAEHQRKKAIDNCAVWMGSYSDLKKSFDRLYAYAHASEPVKRKMLREQLQQAEFILDEVGRIVDAPSNDEIVQSLRGIIRRWEDEISARKTTETDARALAESLHWYANKKNYDEGGSPTKDALYGGYDGVSDVQEDRGEKARAAISAHCAKYLDSAK